MKVFLPRTRLLFTAGISTVCIGVFFSRFHTLTSNQLFYLHWLVLAVMLGLMITPFGARKLQTDANIPRYAPLAWFGRIAILQASLYAVYLGVNAICLHLLPINIPTPTHTNFLHSLHTLLLHFGLYPWAFVALFAVSMAFVGYVLKEDALMYALVKPLKATNADDNFALTLNAFGNFATFMALAVTLTFFILLCATLFTFGQVNIVAGMHVITLFVVLVILLLIVLKPGKKLALKLFARAIPTPVSLILVVALIGAFMAALFWLFDGFGLTVIPEPKFLKATHHIGWIQFWWLLTKAWWLAWMPLAAISIARISAGYRIRTVILATLCLPALLAGVVWLLHRADWMPSIPLWAAIPVALLGLVSVLIITTNATALPMLMRTYFAKNGQPKRRDHHFYFRRMLQYIAIVLYIYLPAGVPFTAMFAFTFTWPMLVISMMVMISLLIMLIKTKS